MKSLMQLVECILLDAGMQCTTTTTRDFKTIEDRVGHEGLSFLTITLPSFSADFERCLSAGQVVPTAFRSFASKRKKGKAQCLPAFLLGFTGLVFNSRTGVILDEPNIEAIAAVRQICRAAAKLALECNTNRTNKAYIAFKKCDAEVPTSITASPADWDDFTRLSRVLWSNVFEWGQSNDPIRDARARYLRKIGGTGRQANVCDRERDFSFEDQLVPRHGPGATAEKLKPNSRYEIRQWTRRLQKCFPADAFAYASLNHALAENSIEELPFVEPGDEQPVRVVHVPKTMKGPRIIAIEPACMQYTQQALARYIIKCTKASDLTRGKLVFDDQSVNQSRAMSGSVDGSLSTIDLSEASDRVSAVIVSKMLMGIPHVRDAAFACRSTKAQLPSGHVVTLQKFASMGSALCFPIEAMVFFTLSTMALLREHKLSPSLRNILRVTKEISVYGDDIIVPTRVVATVMATLSLFGLKVNTAKSFTEGYFRESCGTDAYAGVNVTPVYIRRMLPHDRRLSKEIISSVQTANQFYLAGYWNAARYMRNHIERLVGHELPHVRETSQGLGWVSLRGEYSFSRWNDQLHRYETRAFVPVTPRQRDPIGDYTALLKYFLKVGIDPFQDEKHLEESVRSGTVSIKRRWVTPY